MAEEQNPSVRKGTLQEQYADLFRRIAELEKEDVSPTWDRLLYAFTGIGDKELAAPSRQERKKAQKEIIAGLKVELERIGKELGEFPEKFEIIKARRLERAAERDINDKLKAQEKKEDAINDLKSEVETRLRKEIGVDLTEPQERDLDRFVNLMGDIPYGQELDFEEIVGSQVLSSGQAMEDAVKAMFSEIPGIRGHHLTEGVMTERTGIHRRELGAEGGLGAPEPARVFEETVLGGMRTEPDPVLDAIRKAGMRHLISTQYLTGEGAKVTENDIRRNPAKYKAALDTYVRVVRQKLGADPLYFSMFQDPSMQQMLIAGIKARLWFDENGQLFQPDKNDEHYDLILQIRSGEKIKVPGHDEEQPAISVFPSLLGAVDTALSLSGNTFGPEFSETLAMEQKLVDQEFIYAKLEEKLVRAGGDVSKPNVQLWLGSKAQSIAVQAMQELPFIAGISSQVQDQTPAWEKVFEMIEDLGDLNPDTIETEGYALMAAGDQREFFAAWVRHNPGMLAAIPDPMDRELFINNGFNEIKQRWLASPIDEETGRRTVFSQWLKINGVREVPEILDIAYAIEGGLDSDVGRKEYFKNLARATLWVGAPILSDDPTPFEDYQMDRIIHEAEQEFQNKGAIAGTWEDIVKEKLENWDAVVRGSQQLDPIGPPGMTDFPDIALEGVAELEARIGGANLNVEVKNNNDLMIQLEGRMSIEQRIQDYNIAAGRDPDPTRASRIRSLQVQLKDVRSEGTKLKGQQGERDKQAGLHELLTNDAQLAQAFATGNQQSLQIAALERRINPSIVQDLVNAQRRSGLQDRGEKRFATPEEIAAEKRMRSIAAARRSAQTIRYDAQGNVMPGDPTIDEYNVRTGVRTDPEGNIVEPIPSDPADRVDEKGNALPGMARMIPNTDLLDTQENRDAISRGTAEPGTRQGEGFETDDLGNILTDDEGKPIPVAPFTGGPDYVAPDLILGTRREWPKRFGSIARPIVSKPPVAEPIQEEKEDTPQPQGPIFGFDVPVGEGQGEFNPNLPPAKEQTAAQVITGDADMRPAGNYDVGRDEDEEEKVPGSLKPRKGAKNAT